MEQQKYRKKEKKESKKSKKNKELECQPNEACNIRSPTSEVQNTSNDSHYFSNENIENNTENDELLHSHKSITLGCKSQKHLEESINYEQSADSKTENADSHIDSRLCVEIDAHGIGQDLENEVQTFDNSHKSISHMFESQKISEESINNEQSKHLKIENEDPHSSSKLCVEIDVDEIGQDMRKEDPKKVQTFDEVLDKNKSILNKLNLEQIHNNRGETKNKVRNHEVKLKIYDSIRPYSETQLSAFYTNTELHVVDDFTEHFIEAELRGLAIKKHPLYELLSRYLHAKEKLSENSLELNQLKREYKEFVSQLWSTTSVSTTAKGICQDGTLVTASHSSEKATFHRSVYQSLFRTISKIQECAFEHHVLYSYSAEDLKLQIEIYLQRSISHCMNITQINKQKNVSLSIQDEPLQWKPYLNELRLCISILFGFQRRQVKDQQFIKETRKWLTHLVSILLRLANYQDHLFLLSHILRCPAGVGSWASNFVQMPLSENIDCPFSSYEINHILTVLTIILSPIKERDKFLEEIAQMKDATQEALWVMVDSDGEEDEEPSGTSLRENDLVAMMNQLPLENLFKALLMVKQNDFENHYDDSAITENHILRFLAFSTNILKIFNIGLQSYNQPRYTQFSKRLSRLIRHIVQYATDQWERFCKIQTIPDSAMLKRLQVEYDAFFLRAVYSLYTSQKLGAWQFLAVVPYNLVSINTLWKIFYFLHDSDSFARELLTPSNMKEFDVRNMDSELKNQFNEKLSELSDAEIYYLLNTFANMALARTEEDFIEVATMDLLQIGFINKTTQELCSKTSRILLSHITSKYPDLLSNILKAVKENIDEIEDLALYLYEELPLSVWQPKRKDFVILSRLLMTTPVTQVESKLARMILARLNWGFNESGVLYLPYEFHCDVARLVLQSVDQEPGYLNWGWQTILRLKLHISDKGFAETSKVIEIERCDIILRGVRDKKPLCTFVALLMTSWGHLVPLICSKGLGLLLFLQTQQKHEAVLFVLYLIMPLFLNSQECLINCSEFQEILSNLLAADRSYMSMAKAFIGTQNTVLQQFGNMIETQIVNCKNYGLESPRLLVRLWMNSLVSVENWTRDYGVLYLLDVIIRAAFFHRDALEAAENVLKDLLQATTPQDQGGAISSIFKWVSASPNASLISTSLSPFPWLAYVMITIEHEEREKRTGLWKEILLQLDAQKGKINVDSAIKKAASVVKVSSFSSASLCIYRFAQEALDMPVNHPLLTLLWQKFFELYLQRIPVSRSVDKGCVGNKFFEGLINFTFLKKLKRRLQETVQYHQDKLEDLEKENGSIEDISYCKSCLRIFHACDLWLEEPRIQEANLLLQSLPLQYEANLLLHIIQGNSKPWYEYIDYKKVKQEQQESIRVWRVSNFREPSNVNRPLLNAGVGIESEDPVERILRRLTSYDAPKPAPELTNSTSVIPSIDLSNLNDMFKMLKPHFNVLKHFAHDHLRKVSGHKEINCTYQNLIPQLYWSVPVKLHKKVPCRGKNQSVNCSGAATIELNFEESRINDSINLQIENNRQAYESSLASSLNPPSATFCSSTVLIQYTIRTLQKQLETLPESAELGVELFYYLLPMLDEEIINYLPTKTLFVTCLEKLGQSHINGVGFEMPRLLQRILKEPKLSEYLVPHFCLGNVGTANLLEMYQSISEEVGQKYDVSFALLSKFDIDEWLQLKNPKLNERSKFIEFVFKGLSVLGNEPPIDALTLHGLYRKHLLSVFEYQFPEHYGEILINLLRSSSGTTDVPPLAISVWVDVLNSLAYPSQIHMKIPLREQLRTYAQIQQRLGHQEIVETVELLARHFTQERLQYGLYGIYPKCRHYLDVYAILLGMAGHALIITSLNTHQGLMSDKMCEKIWPHIRDMFAPWIAPYSMQNLKENMASWIQQLADDRSVLLPWITADVSSAQKILNAFQECIQFLLHVLPACGVILNSVWQWYVATFAHASVKEHVLNPIHQTLMVLPWLNFWPSVNDLDIMLRVVDQYLPECHQFLGIIFISVNWMNWMNHFSNCPVQLRSRVYQCFINLLVKLSNEPNIRSKYVEKFNGVLIQAESLDWVVLDPNVYQHVMDWYIMSCDPIVIFKTDPTDLDLRVLQFLKTVSGYEEVIPDNGNPNTLHKRYIYVRSYVKLMSVFTSRHKLAIPVKENEILSVINNQVKHLERVVRSRQEMAVILCEFLNILNINSIGNIGMKCMSQWISNKPGDDIVIETLLQVSSEAVTNLGYVANLYELALESYFQNANEHHEPSWANISDTIKVGSTKQIELEQEFLNQGTVLTLNAWLLQKGRRINDYNVILSQCLDWLSNIKLSVSVESKLPLIWLGIINLSLKYSETDEPDAGGVLYKFCQILLQTADEKGNSSWGRGILSAIGISKTETKSLPFKFLCRALAGYILAQLPEMKGEPQVIRKTPNAPAKVGQPGGNTECVKILLKLDFGQSQGKLKDCAELALNQIQDPNNSLLNAGDFLISLTKQFFNKPYFKNIS